VTVFISLQAGDRESKGGWLGGTVLGEMGFCSPGQPGGMSQLWTHWSRAWDD